jgi:hypothetical protein
MGGATHSKLTGLADFPSWYLDHSPASAAPQAVGYINKVVNYFTLEKCRCRWRSLQFSWIFAANTRKYVLLTWFCCSQQSGGPLLSLYLQFSHIDSLILILSSIICFTFVNRFVIHCCCLLEQLSHLHWIPCRSWNIALRRGEAKYDDNNPKAKIIFKFRSSTFNS